MRTALQNMTEKLQELGIYRIEPDNHIDKELHTYASALDTVTDIADNLLKEIIINTATDYGLSWREQLWGIVRNELPTDQRRTTIRKRFTINADDFTLNGMQNFLSSLGIDTEIIEKPSQYRMYINVFNGNDFTIPIRYYLTQQIEEFFPAHCMVFVDYRTNGTWNDLDFKRIYFSVYDSFNYTWNYLENFE